MAGGGYTQETDPVSKGWVMLTCDGVTIIRKSVKQMVLRVGYEAESTELTKIDCCKGEEARIVPEFLFRSS